MAAGPEGFMGFPQELVDRAQQDPEFAARLLHFETRKDALDEVGVELTHDLDHRLAEIGNMSLREAMSQMRGKQQLQA